MSLAPLLLAAQLALPGRVLVLAPAGPERGAPGWIGAAVEEVLPRALQRAGMDAVPSADRRRALDALGIPGPLATRATGIRVAEALGARHVLFGAWELGSTELSLTLRPFDVASAELGPALVARGPLESLGRLTGELAAQLAGSSASGAMLVPTAFPVLQALGEGLVARDPAARVQGARRALELAPGDPDAALALARLLYDAGRHDEARAALAALAAGPRFERERRFLEGACLLALGRYADADILFAELASRDPAAAVLSNRSVARLRVLPGRNGASVLARQALDKAPLATDLAFGLGWAHFVEGDLDAAVYWLRDAVRGAPSDARARLALSWALRGTAHAEEAEEQWRAAAALDASLEGEKAPDATRRLERILPSETALLLDPDREAGSGQPPRER